ncbi:MAG: signal peptide peptidase SppA [Rhodospirillales bacterium]|nr:signal peptide peptidase SppA [Rhodospirillales bacterium]
MSLETDQIVDRRRLKRRLGVWRLVAVLSVIAAGVVLASRFEGIPGRPYVARLSVDGLIVDDSFRDQALADVAEDDKVRALIVEINSPGGTVVGGESLFRHLRKVAESKPVVAVMGELATSAGYMTALGADRLFARSGTITGSIGVILQTADITGLLEKLGIKPEVVKSGPMKAQPNPFEPFSPQAREVALSVVLDIHEMFIDMVTDRRGLSRGDVTPMADGRIYTGRQALANGLIDALGGIGEARNWLDEKHSISATLPLKNVKIRGDEDFFDKLVPESLGKMLFSERLRLDGLVSLWHPDLR